MVHGLSPILGLVGGADGANNLREASCLGTATAFYRRIFWFDSLNVILRRWGKSMIMEGLPAEGPPAETPPELSHPPPHFPIITASRAFRHLDLSQGRLQLKKTNANCTPRT